MLQTETDRYSIDDNRKEYYCQEKILLIEHPIQKWITHGYTIRNMIYELCKILVKEEYIRALIGIDFFKNFRIAIDCYRIENMDQDSNV
jgi:hypothetical protein